MHALEEKKIEVETNTYNLANLGPTFEKCWKNV